MGRIQESMIHERNAMNNWTLRRTSAIKDIRLIKKQRIITPTSSAMRKSTITYARPCGQVNE